MGADAADGKKAGIDYSADIRYNRCTVDSDRFVVLDGHIRVSYDKLQGGVSHAGRTRGKTGIAFGRRRP